MKFSQLFKVRTSALLIASAVSTVNAGDCIEIGKVCLDGPSTKNINGVNVTRECWQYESTYSCLNSHASESDRCEKLREEGCYETTSSCIDQQDGQCMAWSKEMFCPDGNNDGGIQDCSAKSFCMDGACFDTSYKPNADLAKTVAILEMGRQIGNYMDTGIFGGVAEGCREGYAGIRDCCDSQPAGEAASLSNQALMSIPVSLAMSGASYAWKYGVYKATPYVYDFVTGTLGPGAAAWMGFTAPAAATAATAATTTGAAAAAPAFTWNFSFAGFGWTSGAAGAAGPFGASSTPLFGAQAGGPGFYFSPIGFAIFAAVYVYGQLSSCEEDEMMLALKRGANVCDPVREADYCSKKILGSCVETRHMFCCYNSVIAKQVNVQGKNQLGIPRAYGKGNPNCSPLTLEQIQSLDFNTIDLSEFYSSITPSGLSESEWQARIDKAQEYQNSRAIDCTKYTGQEYDACVNSGKFEIDGAPANMSSQITADKLVSQSGSEFWQERAGQRIDYSMESGRADVQTPPPGAGYDE